MNRIVVIKQCNHCPFYLFDDQRDSKEWGKGWCTKLDAEVFESIPEKCPLPVTYGELEDHLDNLTESGKITPKSN